jgi:FAD/FMN-containing dehydrogenase
MASSAIIAYLIGGGIGMNGKEPLEKIVGSQNVIDSLPVLEEYSGDLSFVPRIKPRYVVRPENAPQVQKIVQWANETLTPLVPISSGPPHFRGDSVPGVGGAVIVDLSRMNRIIRVDPHNRVAMVEPGVTFAQLLPELARAGLSAYTPLSPRGTKSVIGSMLEREPITMPAHHWDATDPMLCAEMVFGTGDILRGGGAAGPDPIEKQWELGKAQMTPMGLGQFNEHRLISGAQGTIGIVTWSTLKCRYLSKLNRTFLVPAANIDPLIDLSYQLLRIRLGDHCFILNGLNLACLLAGTADGIQALKKVLPEWVLIVSFEGTGEMPEEKVQYQEADFEDIARFCRLQPATAIPGADEKAIASLLSSPSGEPYWKLRYKGVCHDIFFLTTLDKTPSFISAISGLKYPAADIGVYIQPIVQGTSCHCEFNLFADPRQPTEIDDARWMVKDGSRKLAKQGAYFSRPYGDWADFAFDGSAEAIVMQRKVKKIFDPRGILNPARLRF